METVKPIKKYLVLSIPNSTFEYRLNDFVKEGWEVAGQLQVTPNPFNFELTYTILLERVVT